MSPERLAPLTPDSFPVALQPPAPPAPNGPVNQIIPFAPGDKDGSLTGPIGRTGTVIAGDLDNPPRVRAQTAPQYPFGEKAQGVTGEVLVEFTVDERGAVLEPRVVRSSSRVFEEPTLRAVAKWRFEPGKRDGRVVRFKMVVPVVFSLTEN